MIWKKIGKHGSCDVLEKPIHDGVLRVIVGKEPFGKNGEIGWHLSISHRSSLANPHSPNRVLPGRLPTWDEIKEARYHFVPDEAEMAMFLPPKSEYVNVHPTTMHLYESL